MSVASEFPADEDLGRDRRVPRGGPVAGGKPVTLTDTPELPEWHDPSLQDDEDGADGSVDYTDLTTVTHDLMRQRVRLNRTRRRMRAAAREATEARLRYHRALRRALVQQSGGSAEMRRAAAELLCEELEADMVMKQQVADEYSSLFRSVRDDIDNAKTASYNLRTLAQF